MTKRIRTELAALPELEAGAYRWIMPIAGTPTALLDAQAVRAVAAVATVFPGARACGWRYLGGAP